MTIRWRWNWQEPRFQSWDDCDEVYHQGKVRNPFVGKHLSTGLKLRQNADKSYDLIRWGQIFARINKGMVLTLYALNPADDRQIPVTHVASWKERSTKRVGWTSTTQAVAQKLFGSTYQVYRTLGMHRSGSEFFPGIQFDLVTGTCLNPRPDKVWEVIEEERAKWNAALKEFRSTFKAAMRLGVFDEKPEAHYWEQRSQASNALYEMITTGKTEFNLWDFFVWRASYWSGSSASVSTKRENTKQALNYMISTHRRAFKHRFGVYRQIR